MRVLRDELHTRLVDGVPGPTLNEHPEFRLPNTRHLAFPRVTGRALPTEAAAVVTASVGSACHCEGDAVGGVLAAMGIDAARTADAVRLSVGWMTTTQDIACAAGALIAAWWRPAHP